MEIKVDINLQYIRDTYQVPAYKDARVHHEEYGKGRIKWARGVHLKLQFDTPRPTGPFHPTDKLTYLDEQGNQIWPEVKV